MQHCQQQGYAAAVDPGSALRVQLVRAPRRRGRPSLGLVHGAVAALVVTAAIDDKRANVRLQLERDGGHTFCVAVATRAIRATGDLVMASARPSADSA